MLLGSLTASAIRNMLAGKGVIRASEEQLGQVEEQLELVRSFNTDSLFN